MSSILDALEKASKDRKDAAGSGASLGAESLRERRLREDAERSRRRFRLAAIMALCAVALAGGALAILQPWKAPPPAPAAAPIEVRVSYPDPAPPAATPTPFPSPTPWPSPSPAPSATPAPSPSPRIAATPTPIASTDGFADGQRVRPAELGWQIDGVAEMGDARFVIINGESVRAGTKFQGYHIIEVQPGRVDVDLGNGKVVVVLF